MRKTFGKALAVMVLAAAVFSLTACNLAARLPRTTQQPPPADPAYTYAAQTIIAQLTQAVQPTTAVPPQPGLTQLPSTPLATEPPVAETSAPITPEPEMTATGEPTVPPATAAATTAPSTPTAAAPTATTSSSDPKASLGDPDWEDNFDGTKSWPVYSDDHVDFEWGDEGLTMRAINADGWDSWIVNRPALTDFYVELTARTSDCSGMDRYGMLVRAPDPSQGYLFGFSCDGKYSLRQWDGDKFTVLVDWTASPAILAGADQTNRMGFKAEGSSFSLYANGTLLTQVEDDSYDEGRLGLFIGAKQTPGFEVEALNMVYWKLP